MYFIFWRGLAILVLICVYKLYEKIPIKKRQKALTAIRRIIDDIDAENDVNGNALEQYTAIARLLEQYSIEPEEEGFPSIKEIFEKIRAAQKKSLDFYEQQTREYEEKIWELALKKNASRQFVVSEKKSFAGEMTQLVLIYAVHRQTRNGARVRLQRLEELRPKSNRIKNLLPKS